jgi:RHS repeat-associated protein
VPGTGNLGAFAYTGRRMLPELGRYYYKVGIYDPYLGRFLQADNHPIFKRPIASR